MRLSGRRGPRLRFGIIASVIFVILACLTYQDLPLLGDGSLRANEVLDFTWVHPTEFLDQLTHALAFHYVFEPLALKPTICYRVISIISGVVFIWGAFRLSLYLLPQQAVFGFFAMVTSGMAVQFFGYVESYSILAGLLPWIVLVLVRAVDSQKSLTVLCLWIVIAALIHSVTLFLFGLPLAAAIVLAREDDPQLRKKLFIVGAVVIAIGTLVWYELAYLGIGSAARYLLPIFPTGDPGQGLLTVDHALNLLNWLFLSSLPFLVFLPQFIGSVHGEAVWTSNRRLLALTIVFSSLWFLFFFNPQLGGPRDWDLFSLPAFMLIPATLLVISTLNITRRMMRPLLPVLVVSLVLMWSFATVNASLDRSVDRYLEVLEVSRFKNQWIEYGQLHELSAQRPELRHRRLEFIMKAWHEPPRDSAEVALTAIKIAQVYFESGEKDKANQFIDRAMAANPFNLDAYVVRLRALNTPSDQRLAIATAELMLRLMPDSARALREAGIVYLRFGQPALAIAFFESALSLDPNDYSTLMNLGSHYLSADSGRERSVEYLSKAVLQRPNDFRANFYLALAFEDAGRPDQARKYLAIASRLVTTKEQQSAVKTMSGRISLN